ncbi:MAG: hypothetical protein KME32_21995 [Mojavia pulchra JT2-VF2]|jgi:hypothetical protein|uniref:Uncharacterized protein n=1 Tax=Mojavia pulchra JT2-VF2 TaxID=287848 RepID=A0A951Q2Y8_9NOST|nr:hypothetical protein [Mojavia pulchra JT2-VF2]
MSQSNLINKSEVSKSREESFLIELLSEIQETPQEYWSNLLEIIRVFRKSVTIKPELLTNSPEELDKHEQKILHHQHQALKKLTKQWLEEGDGHEQTETWEYLNQAIDDNAL